MSFEVSTKKRKIGKTTETIKYVRKSNNKSIESDEAIGLYDDIVEKLEMENPDAKH